MFIYTFCLWLWCVSWKLSHFTKYSKYRHTRHTNMAIPKKFHAQFICLKNWDQIQTRPKIGGTNIWTIVSYYGTWKYTIVELHREHLFFSYVLAFVVSLKENFIMSKNCRQVDGKVQYNQMFGKAIEVSIKLLEKGSTMFLVLFWWTLLFSALTWHPNFSAISK